MVPVKAISTAATFMIPSYVMTPVTMFMRVHQLWCLQQRVAEITKDPRSTALYAAGSSAQIITEGTFIEPLYQAGAKSLEIYRVMLLCVKRTNELIESYRELVQAWKQTYLIYVKVDIPQNVPLYSPYFFIRAYDPALEIWVRMELRLVAIRAEQIFIYTSKFGWSVFTLSSAILEFRISKEDAGRRAFNNLDQVINDISVFEIEKSQKVVEEIVSKMGVKLEVNKILNNVKTHKNSIVTTATKVVSSVLSNKKQTIPHYLKTKKKVEQSTVIGSQ